jgi:2-polyprenyl-3-methyl-5-hydroxy-6-metoxy-1,4-benzoquinol methylase
MQSPISETFVTGGSLLYPKEARAAGLRDELSFWDEWLRTKSSAWPGDYQNRLDPKFPLSQKHSALIDLVPEEEIRILDVGAGPLTILGKKHPSKLLNIQAVDILAERYDQLLAKYNVQPLIRTQFAEAERLYQKFEENSFHLVTARNCLDHAVDPLEAIRQILFVTMKRCFAVLDHAENEGETQRYQGLHQWNFTVIEGDLIVKGSGQMTNVSKQLSHLGDFRCSLNNQWVTVWIRKR